MNIESFTVKIKKHKYYLNVTERVQAIVKNLRLQNGHILISQKHTTCALIVQEDKPCLIEDMVKCIVMDSSDFKEKSGKILSRSSQLLQT